MTPTFQTSGGRDTIKLTPDYPGYLYLPDKNLSRTLSFQFSCILDLIQSFTLGRKDSTHSDFPPTMERSVSDKKGFRNAHLMKQLLRGKILCHTTNENEHQDDGKIMLRYRRRRGGALAKVEIRVLNVATSNQGRDGNEYQCLRLRCYSICI